MNRRNGALRGAGLALGVLVLAGCATHDEIYVSNFTDAHGRACTFVYTAREGEGFGESRGETDDEAVISTAGTAPALS